MSHRGPSLCRTKDGLTIAKFSGKTFRFGRADDPESRVRFQQFKARWEVAGRQLTSEVLDSRGRTTSPDSLTVTAMVDRYLEHLRIKHNARWIRNNLARVDFATRPLVELCGALPAREFSPKRLKAVQQIMIDSGKLCRGEINSRVRAIRKAFKWAVAEELVPSHLAHALEAVESIAKGRFSDHRTGYHVEAASEPPSATHATSVPAPADP